MLKRPRPATKYHHLEDIRPAITAKTIAKGTAIKTAIHTVGTH